MHEVPFGIETMMVQVLPSPVVRTSTNPPLLVTPMATGDSPYFLARCPSTSLRGLQAPCAAPYAAAPNEPRVKTGTRAKAR